MKAVTNRVTVARLLQHFDTKIGVGFFDPLNFVPSVVGGASFDKNKFRLFAHRRSTGDRCFDVAGFVCPGRNQYGYAQVLFNRVARGPWSGDEKCRNAEPRQQGSEQSINGSFEPSESKRK